jgi:hypothetical protein
MVYYFIFNANAAKVHELSDAKIINNNVGEK